MFRKVVKDVNPDAYITGEIWSKAQAWLRGDMFDSVMNYIFSRAALGFFGADTLHTEYKPGGFPLKALTSEQFAQTVDEMLALYDWEVNLAQLNLMDSHDTARTLWTVREDEQALRLCTLFQMTMPGAPCIYYGDEIGMTGANDPYCRAAFPWQNKASWNQDLLEFYKRAIDMRHQHPALRTGSYKVLHARGNIYAFNRVLDTEEMIVVFNVGHQQATIDLALTDGLEDGVYTAVWGEGRYPSRSAKLSGITVAGREALVLKRREES